MQPESLNNLFFIFFALTLTTAAEDVALQGNFTAQLLRVVSILDAPFLMLSSGDQKLNESNNKFIGYCADLTKRLSQMLNNVPYEMKIVKDGRFGYLDEKTGEWNGIIGELVRDEADLGIGPLTISSNREKAVDFTYPFMTVGVSLMMKKPFKEVYFFRFLSPFDLVWFCSLVGYVSITIGLFFLSMYKSFDMKKSLAFWFFTCLFFSAYILNLVAYLSFEKGSGINVPIKSAEDLQNRSEMRYGTVEGGTTAQFFRNSNNTIYKHIWNQMKVWGSSVMVKNNQEGFLKVKESAYYAFFLESSMNDYFSKHSGCGTMRVGENLDQKGYGIATQSGSTLREKLNVVLLKLREEGFLEELKNKYWSEPDKECSVKEFIDSGYYLTNVSIVIFILILGAFVAVLIALVELLREFC